jgi:hypothetical protein
MKTVKLTIYFLISSFLLTSCLSGKYVSKSRGEAAINQAPMRLKLCGNAEYTYYAYSNSAVTMYQEDAKFKKKGDTVYMRSRTYYGDTTEISKDFMPRFVIMGDSLVSLDYNMAYVKKKK